jgi:hypothetical protein
MAGYPQNVYNLEDYLAQAMYLQDTGGQESFEGAPFKSPTANW